MHFLPINELTVEIYNQIIYYKKYFDDLKNI